MDNERWKDAAARTIKKFRRSQGEKERRWNKIIAQNYVCENHGQGFSVFI